MLVDCPRCSGHVEAAIKGEFAVPATDVDPPGRYALLQCGKCNEPLLVIQEQFPHGYDDPYRLYPAQERKLSPDIPSELREAFDEARACFKAKAYTATAIMCRKTLDGICSLHGTTKRNLRDNLKELHSKEIIDSRLFEWADALRMTGNDAAHDVKVTMSRRDAQDMTEFTEVLLDQVYTYRKKFLAFQTRRAATKTAVVKAKAPTTTPPATESVT